LPIYLVVGVLVVLAVLFVVMMRLGGKVDADNAARFAQAQMGRATVKQVGQSYHAKSGGGIITDLTLDVLPESGALYQAAVKWRVERSAISKVQAGQSLTVKIDRDDPQRIYPIETWARFIGSADNA